jgi:hypothetical protein
MFRRPEERPKNSLFATWSRILGYASNSVGIAIGTDAWVWRGALVGKNHLKQGKKNMVRNAAMHVLILCAAWVVASTSAVAQEEVRDDVVPQISTLSLGQLILRDTFDDNKTASIWDVWASDSSTCWVTEVNSRLEVRATSAAEDASAGYVGNAWRLDPRGDFTMKVNFHMDILSSSRGWVYLGVTADSQAPRDRCVGIYAQSVNLWKSLRCENKNGYAIESTSADRASNEGTLYVSYDASDDVIYLSMVGYGVDHAAAAYQGVLQEAWGGQPVYVFVGGGSDGLNIPSGSAYLDGVEVDSGIVIESSLQKVYHFKSVVGENHFYTMSEGEKEKLLTKYTDSWKYIGVAFYAFPENSDASCKAVYRFWNSTLKTHFFTASVTEKTRIQGTKGWTYEGIAFYAYPANTSLDGTHPVYRFWSPTHGSHFYTIDETEKANLVKNSSSVWTYEGVAWRAYE